MENLKKFRKFNYSYTSLERISRDQVILCLEVVICHTVGPGLGACIGARQSSARPCLE